MKTLIITLEYPPQIGGIASYVANFTAHIPPEEVVVYAPVMKGDKEFDAQNNWKVYRRDTYWLFIWPRGLGMFFQVRRIVKKEKIERIHIHNVLPVGYIGYLLRKLSKVPYTIFLHGTDFQLAIQDRSKFKKFRRVVRTAELVVVNSTFLKKKLLERVEDLANVRVNYPCPADFFLTTSITEEEKQHLLSQLALEGKKVILTVARMVEGKGYPHIIRLLPNILKEIPNLVWIIIGDGPKKQMVIDQLQKQGLQNVVRFLGLVPLAELPKYYQIADTFVLLTHPDETAEEGWGTVFLEAAASGVPVVAGRVGGVEEAVEHMGRGIVVDVQQGKAVVETIVQLLKNPEYAREMGRKGRERVEKEFK